MTPDPLWKRSSFYTAAGLTIMLVVKWIAEGAFPEESMWTALGAWGIVFGVQKVRPTAPVNGGDDA